MVITSCTVYIHWTVISWAQNIDSQCQTINQKNKVQKPALVSYNYDVLIICYAGRLYSYVIMMCYVIQVGYTAGRSAAVWSDTSHVTATGLLRPASPTPMTSWGMRGTCGECTIVTVDMRYTQWQLPQPSLSRQPVPFVNSWDLSDHEQRRHRHRSRVWNRITAKLTQSKWKISVFDTQQCDVW